MTVRWARSQIHFVPCLENISLNNLFWPEPLHLFHWFSIPWWLHLPLLVYSFILGVQFQKIRTYFLSSHFSFQQFWPLPRSIIWNKKGLWVTCMVHYTKVENLYTCHWSERTFSCSLASWISLANLHGDCTCTTMCIQGDPESTHTRSSDCRSRNGHGSCLCSINSFIFITMVRLFFILFNLFFWAYDPNSGNRVIFWSLQTSSKPISAQNFSEKKSNITSD